MKKFKPQHKDFVKSIPLPKTISIGFQDIKVIEADLIEAQGCYRNELAEIHINRGMGAREQLNTVIHEVLHAICYAYGLKKEFEEDEDEEMVVNALANGITEALVRNKGLVELIRQSV